MTIRSIFKASIHYLQASRLRIIFVTIWAIFVLLIIKAGFETNPYAFPESDLIETPPYPMNLVMLLVGIMTLQLSLLVVVDIYIKSHWKLLPMLLIAVLFLGYFGLWAMHAPPTVSWMIIWQSLLCLTLLIVSLITLIYFAMIKYMNSD